MQKLKPNDSYNCRKKEYYTKIYFESQKNILEH